MIELFEAYARTLTEELSRDPTVLSSATAKRLALVLNGIIGEHGRTPSGNTPSAATASGCMTPINAHSAPGELDLMKAFITCALDESMAVKVRRTICHGVRREITTITITTKKESGESESDHEETEHVGSTNPQ